VINHVKEADMPSGVAQINERRRPPFSDGLKTLEIEQRD
jgi:hypothetical protein